MLDSKTKAQYKRKLIQKGINIATISSDEQLIELYNTHCDNQPLAQTAQTIDIQAARKNATPANEPKSKDSQDVQNLISQLMKALASNMDESRVIELIKEHSSDVSTVEIKKFDAPTVKIKNTHKQFEQVLKLLSLDINVYLVGPAGCGKTTLASQCAQALELDFEFTGAVLQKYELTGFVDAGGVYQETAFYRAFKNGGVFLFDEMDASSASALIAFNTALANGLFTFPNGEQVKKHADFKCIAASNTKGSGATRDYSGRNKLDGATLDRYVMVEVAIDEKVELAAAYENYTVYGGDNLDSCAELIHSIRQLRKEAIKKDLPAIISPRASLEGAKMLAAGYSLDQIINACVLSKLDDDSANILKGSV